MNRRIGFLCLTVCIMTTAWGCSRAKGNIGKMSLFRVPEQESMWIRDGQPIEFEGDFWYPQDSIEVLLDQEMYMAGEYRGVQFFVEKADVRPYKAVYTKFDRNKFRLYRKRTP